MGFSISDIDKPCDASMTCQRCYAAPATDMIEWQDDEMGGRWWERFCAACLEKALAEHRKLAQLEQAADAAAAARLGVDPKAFCEGCGYRVCRCGFDPLRQGSGNVAFTGRR